MPSFIRIGVFCAYCGGPLDTEGDFGRKLYEDGDFEYDDNGLGDLLPYKGPWVITEEEMKWVEKLVLIGRVGRRCFSYSCFNQSDITEYTFIRKDSADFSRYVESEGSDFFIRQARWLGDYGVAIIDGDGLPKDVIVYDHRHDQRYFADMPVHVSCFSISMRLAESRRKQYRFDKPSTVEEIYDSINSQSRADKKSIGVCLVALACWSHGYYGASNCHGRIWYPKENDGSEVKSHEVSRFTSLMSIREV